MLGSLSEADDAVQEAWLRLSRSDADAVANLGGWLTTVVGRVCLDMLRARRAGARTTSAAGCPSRSSASTSTPTPSRRRCSPTRVGLALLVVLETLTPAERLAFVLHDMFGVPFDEIAAIVDRIAGRGPPAREPSAAARARRRARSPTPTWRRQREVVDAFLAAARAGDFEALLAVLDPDVVFRIDAGLSLGARPPVTGAEAVARQVLARGAELRAARAPGDRQRRRPASSWALRGRPIAVVGFTLCDGRIVAIDIVTDPDKLHLLHH